MGRPAEVPFGGGGESAQLGVMTLPNITTPKTANGRYFMRSPIASYAAPRSFGAVRLRGSEYRDPEAWRVILYMTFTNRGGARRGPWSWASGYSGAVELQLRLESATGPIPEYHRSITCRHTAAHDGQSQTNTPHGPGARQLGTKEGLSEARQGRLRYSGSAVANTQNDPLTLQGCINLDG